MTRTTRQTNPSVSRAFVSTPSRIRTGDLLRESSETCAAAISSYAGVLGLSIRPWGFAALRDFADLFPRFWPQLGVRGQNPRPRSHPFGDSSANVRNGDTPRASGMLGRGADRHAEHRKAGRVGRPARIRRAAGGAGSGGLLLWARRSAGPLGRRRLWRHRSIRSRRPRRVHARDARLRSAYRGGLRPEHGDTRVAAFDLTFSAPKSVSVPFAIARTDRIWISAWEAPLHPCRLGV